MTSRKLLSAAAAASLAGVAVLGLGTPAFAQDYPPADSPAAISDSTVVPGQTVTANSGSGSFVAGSSVDVMVLGVSTTRTADASGNVSVTFRVPENTPPGDFSVVFSNDTNRVEVPFTVVAAAAAGPGQGQGQTGIGLPLTGADQIVPLTITGVALVGIGAGIVVASRRRRETSMPAGLA
ncbi:MAG: LPXTG cell wall anchor domain-containing protein [Actinobacteria bacterium]|nr:LPXTG cell wall anchor domain-containing protein [Actinomycetota bacterium]